MSERGLFSGRLCVGVWRLLGGGLFLWTFVVGVGCFGAQKQVRSAKERFELRARDTKCSFFRDNRTGLRFCVPPNTKLERVSSKSTDEQKFEARLSPVGLQVVISVRKDILPEETPEGALSGIWLKRYAESYAFERKIHKHDLRVRILDRRRARFLKADAAVWMAFPLKGQESVWEEVLILARKPAIRYLISLRIGERTHGEHGTLRRFLVSFLRELRLRS